jgi:topoisomerase-4 subunit A
LSWIDGAGRSFTLPPKEFKEWRGQRAGAGWIVPKGFPKNNKFRGAAGAKSAGESGEE